MNWDGQFLQREREAPVMFLPVSSTSLTQLSALISAIGKNAGRSAGVRNGGFEFQQQEVR